MNKVINFCSNYTAFGISAMDTVLGQSILRGRLFGGVCVLDHNSIASLVTCIAVEARHVILLIGDIVFVNVYLPSQSSNSVVVMDEILVISVIY